MEEAARAASQIEMKCVARLNMVSSFGVSCFKAFKVSCVRFRVKGLGLGFSLGFRALVFRF